MIVLFVISLKDTVNTWTILQPLHARLPNLTAFPKCDRRPWWPNIFRSYFWYLFPLAAWVPFIISQALKKNYLKSSISYHKTFLKFLFYWIRICHSISLLHIYLPWLKRLNLSRIKWSLTTPNWPAGLWPQKWTSWSHSHWGKAVYSAQGFRQASLVRVVRSCCWARRAFHLLRCHRSLPKLHAERAWWPSSWCHWSRSAECFCPVLLFPVLVLCYSHFWCHYFCISMLGKFRTICVFASVYVVGIFILFMTSLPFAIENGAALGGLIAAMIVIGLGTGGIKSNVSPLIADQYTITKPYVKTLKSGERYCRSSYHYSVNFRDVLHVYQCWFPLSHCDYRDGTSHWFLGSLSFALLLFLYCHCFADFWQQVLCQASSHGLRSSRYF